MPEPKLQNLGKFKRLLQNYRPSGRALKALDGLNLVLMAGLSSSGRNTLIHHLLDTGHYYFIVSDTTRPPQVRDGKLEASGVNYFFRPEEEVLMDLEAGEYLEAAVIHNQQVSGISVRELERAKAQNKTAITDIEIVGADNIMRVKPDTRAVFLLPPSFDEWMKRISKRGTMSSGELTNRLDSAEHELAAALHHPYYNYVISEEVDQSVEIINMIASGKTSPHQARGEALAAELRQTLASHLNR